LCCSSVLQYLTNTETYYICILISPQTARLKCKRDEKVNLLAWKLLYLIMQKYKK